MNMTELVDQRTHPVSVALAKAMDEIHADYARIMELREDAEGNFDPLKLPDNRPCVQ